MKAGRHTDQDTGKPRGRWRRIVKKIGKKIWEELIWSISVFIHAVLFFFLVPVIVVLALIVAAIGWSEEEEKGRE